jgi:hypothetical protein
MADLLILGFGQFVGYPQRLDLWLPGSGPAAAPPE